MSHLAKRLQKALAFADRKAFDLEGFRAGVANWRATLGRTKQLCLPAPTS